jgi:hypothetical protein
MHRNQRTSVTNPTLPPPTAGTAYTVAPPTGGSRIDHIRDVGAGETYFRRAFMPAAALGAIVGIALMVIGGIALARAGTGGAFATPDVDVLGWAHNAPLAVAELAGGLLLLVASLSGVRGFLLLIAALLTAGGIVFAIEPDAIDSFTIERSFAVVVAVVAAVVLVTAAMLPTVVRASRHVEREHVIVD